MFAASVKLDWTIFYFMAILYAHIRLDTNQIFYIGISINDKRPFNKSQRNKIWKGITRKTSYRVDILFNNLTWEEACNKEIELIKKYGRINNNTGILCNLTDGGNGTINYKHKQESKDKIGSAWKGKKRGPQSKEHKLKMLETKKLNNSFRGAKKGKPVSEETKQKIRNSVSRNKYTCNHCGKTGTNSVMFRWHFVNCKQNK